MRLHTRMVPALMLFTMAGGAGTGCDAGAEVAAVMLAVEVSAAGVVPVETDLGYTVAVSRMRAAVADLAFTVPGEGLAGAGSRGMAGSPGGVPDPGHPGHVSGGEITGELPGELLVEGTDEGAPLGTATLLVGDYGGADFAFRRAHAGDGLDDQDPLLGHTVHIEGVAERDGASVTFEAALDMDEGSQLIGAPFSHRVTDGVQATLGFAIHTAETYSGKTIFDRIDFAALDQDGEGHVAIAPGSETHNRLRRALQNHDYYSITVQ